MTRQLAQANGIEDIEKETIAVARGNPLLTINEYWASAASKKAWGVMEIDTDFRVVQFAATSMVWGLKNETEATLLASFMTHVMLACNEEQAGKKVYVPYHQPPCVVTVPIVPRGGKKMVTSAEPQQLTLDVPADFPVLYHDAAWSTFLAHFRDDYAIMEPTPVALREDKAWMRELEHRVHTEASFLPNAMWTHEGEMMLLQPSKGMEFVPNASASSGDGDSEEEEEEEEEGGGQDPMDVDGEEEDDD
jgi:hypothetical protein